MKTIIFDIDGTLTDLWPLERAVLLRMTQGKYEGEIDELKRSGLSDTYKIFCKASRCNMSKKKHTILYNKFFADLLKKGNSPKLERYPMVRWILAHRKNYRFVYATGGQFQETLYVLRELALLSCFDVKNSVDKSRCRFSKKTGIPFKKIKKKFDDCLLVTDSQVDGEGAFKAGIEFMKVKPRQENFNLVRRFVL